MKIGGKMQVTREFFAPVIIKIDRITELDMLVKVIEDAMEGYGSSEPEYDTLVDMHNALSEVGL